MMPNMKRALIASALVVSLSLSGCAASGVIGGVIAGGLVIKNATDQFYAEYRVYCPLANQAQDWLVAELNKNPNSTSKFVQVLRDMAGRLDAAGRVACTDAQADPSTFGELKTLVDAVRALQGLPGVSGNLAAARRALALHR